MPSMRGKLIGAMALLMAGAAALIFIWPWGSSGDFLRLPGVVEIQEVRLGPRVSGRVAEVLVSEGDLVNTDQLLLRLDVPELNAQHAQALARLREAEALLDKIRNGSRQQEIDVAEAAALAAKARWERLQNGYRDEERRQAENEFKAAEVDLELARQEFQRATRLLDPGAVGKAEYDTARANFNRAQKRLESARARHDWMQKGPRLEEKREAEAEWKQADANYRLVAAGPRSEDRAAAEARAAEAAARVEELKINLREAEVRAPEPSLIEVVSVRKGDLVPANQPVLRVLRTSDLWVKVYVPETEMGRVRLHQKVDLTVDCFRDRRFRGEVTHITAESEFTPRNVQSVDERRHQVFGLRVRVDDPQGVFKSGMAAEVLVPLHDD
jgi:multidrug resistance efflux pump